MGKTFRRNDRWKKDRRDQNFRKSKKFKDNQNGHQHHNHKLPEVDPQIEDNYDDNTMDSA